MGTMSYGHHESTATNSDLLEDVSDSLLRLSSATLFYDSHYGLEKMINTFGVRSV